MPNLRNPDDVVATLGRSPFRRKFRLSAEDRAQVRRHGLPALLVQAHALVARALVPAAPDNEGKQTPFRGNPLFVAQHGTATCCRRCLNKWHHIPVGRTLSAIEEAYVVSVIECWLLNQTRSQMTLPILATPPA